ncbi:MAG: PIG-L family deacetylase [Deltaproteobacteria bacterium]|nr:PIG-L family deacetylase [Deltaproteobacteria bacterium]
MVESVVFLLPHEDDEFAVFFAIEQAACQGRRPVCLFLTDGDSGGQDSSRRNMESRTVLVRLGVAEADIHFIGTLANFSDGRLYMYLDQALSAVAAVLDGESNVSSLYMPAWEGGHQDHDAVHLIGAVYAGKRGLLGVARQFTLYRRASNMLGVTLFAPLAENGPVKTEPIPWSDRWRYLRLALCYPSQWKSWIGLFPMLAYSYVTKGTLETQDVSPVRLSERPHAGPLLYERRGRAKYDDVRAAADAFLRTQKLAQLDR